MRIYYTTLLFILFNLKYVSRKREIWRGKQEKGKRQRDLPGVS